MSKKIGSQAEYNQTFDLWSKMCLKVEHGGIRCTLSERLELFYQLKEYERESSADHYVI